MLSPVAVGESDSLTMVMFVFPTRPIFLYSSHNSVN